MTLLPHRRNATADHQASRASVIIPTLQRAQHLPELLAIYADHPRVAEVILINNSPEPLSHVPEKVRVLQQSSNIYVNPAWNLGARIATSKHLIISNDDILIAPALIDYGLDLLDRDLYPLIGVHRSFIGHNEAGPPRHRPATHVNLGFGAFMMLRADNYCEIPPEPKIFGGDDWLFWNQRRIPGVILGLPVDTEMGTTSSRSEFSAQALSDLHWCDSTFTAIRGKQRWHHLLPVIDSWYRARSVIAARTRPLFRRTS